MFYVFFTTNNFSFLFLAIVLLMTFLSTAFAFYIPDSRGKAKAAKHAGKSGGWEN